MKRRSRYALLVAGLVATTFSGCKDSRKEDMLRQLEYEKKAKAGDEPLGEEYAPVPPHPTRDALAPLLSKLYSGERLPDVLEGDIELEGDYELSAGVLSRITLRHGLSTEAKVKAIIKATAEADAWVHRPAARKAYAEHIHKVLRAYGKDQRAAVLASYSELKLLDFFNGPDADAALAALPADVAGGAKAMATHYKTAHDAVWQKWLNVQMYARREVSSDEPFRPVLRGLRQRLGKEEPAPAQWATAHEGQLQTWAKAIEKDKDLFGFLMNMREFRDQVEFRGDTHTRWLFQGSAALPAGAAETEIDKKLGFGIHRDDLGGGFSEITFIFPKKLSGTALKKAYVRSLLWRQIYTDYGLLATAGGDYEEKQVPEKYEANYAYCGSEAAYDSGVNAYRSKYSFLADLPAAKMPGEKLLDRAHKCIISMCTPEIKIPAKGDDTDFEGPAPASRLAFFQMLARFEKVDVDLAAMRKKSQKSEEELAAEAFLKANKIKR